MSVLSFVKSTNQNTLYIYIISAILLLKDCFPAFLPTVIQAILLLFIILKSNKHTDIKPIIWYGVFVCYCSFELLMGDRANILMTMFNTLLYVMAYNFCCRTTNDIIHFFKSMTLWGFVVLCFILIKYHSILGYGRLGDYMEGTSYESSIVFSYYIISILCSSIILLIILSKKNIYFYLSVFVLVMGLIIASFNGAKKGILSPIFFMMIYILIKNKKNIMKLCFFMGMLFIVIYFLWNSIKDIEILQRYFVDRFAGLFAFFSGNESAIDVSTEERASYIPIAFNAFLDSPIYGMGGLAHSNDFFKHTIIVNHPHNLFLELLSAGGIILFVIYFIFPFRLLGKLGHSLNNTNLYIVLFSYVLTILFTDLNSSTYNIAVLNVVFVISYRYYIISNSNRKINYAN